MKNKTLRALATTLAVASCINLTGCGTSFIGRGVEDYPLVNATTLQDIKDYYAKSMEYDTIVSRNVEVHEAVYELKDVDSDKKDRLEKLLARAEEILAGNEKGDYEWSEDNEKILSENTFNYLKATLDNVYLVKQDQEVVKFSSALGYYFVDVEYNIYPKSPGTFTQFTPLVGIDGVFVTSPTYGYVIDAPYVFTLAKKLNQYYIENKIEKAAYFNYHTGDFKIIEGGNPADALQEMLIEIGSKSGNTDNKDIVAVRPSLPNEDTDTDTESTTDEVIKDENGNVVDADGNIIMTAEEYESTQNTAEQHTNEDKNKNEENLEITGGMKYESVVNKDRRFVIDSSLVNELLGSALKEKAFIPDLNLVYNKPGKQGLFGGYGIYPEGDAGLTVFGFDRNKIQGTVTIRYVFKDATDGTDAIYGVNAYVTDEEVNTGINVSNSTLVIPNFLESEFKVLIDRSDRLMANSDLTGITSGNLFQDAGIAILRGYKDQNINILKYLSTIRQVIGRDTESNTYLLEVETTVEEGSKYSDTTGTYRDKYFVVVQQQGVKFYITDMLRTSRELVKEPAINPDNATLKRLVALNLSGEVTDDVKSHVMSLMTDWYTACTNRVLYAHDANGNLKEPFIVNGQEIQIYRGMYDCFQTDPSLLSTDKLEYTQSQVRNYLDKYGTNVPVVYSGTVTQWLGGYNNQVEFTTEELVTYSGKSDAKYMTVYYLVSNMNDAWVIDERTVLDERDVTGNELSNIKGRVGQ